jgi:hypothetical protein
LIGQFVSLNSFISGDFIGKDYIERYLGNYKRENTYSQSYSEIAQNSRTHYLITKPHESIFVKLKVQGETVKDIPRFPLLKCRKRAGKLMAPYFPETTGNRAYKDIQ